MSESSSSSQLVSGTNKFVDKQQLTEFQKCVRTELARIRQQMRSKQSDEVKASVVTILNNLLLLLFTVFVYNAKFYF